MQTVHAEQTDGPFERLFFEPIVAAEERQLTVVERVVRVDDSTYTCTIILPSVAEAKNLTFSITAATGLNNITIKDHSSDSNGWTDRTLTTDEQVYSFYSTGSAWTVS